MKAVELEVLTKKVVMDELSQTFLDGRELLDFDQVLNVVNAVVKNYSIPDDEIEQAAKEEADRLHQFGDDTEWYARSLGFIDGAEYVKNKLLGN